MHELVALGSDTSRTSRQNIFASVYSKSINTLNIIVYISLYPSL